MDASVKFFVTWDPAVLCCNVVHCLFNPLLSASAPTFQQRPVVSMRRVFNTAKVFDLFVAGAFHRAN